MWSSGETSGRERTLSILGAGGFLGSHLVEALLERSDFEITAIDTNFAKLRVSSPRLKCIQASLQDTGLLESVVASNRIVVSTTALCTPSLYNTRPLDVIDANFTDLVPLVKLCSERQRWLIHFSTCEVYGRADWDPGRSAARPMSENTSPLILGPIQKERWTYACAKQLLERMIWAQGQHAGLAFTIVRPFNVIGPRMDYLSGVDGEGIPRVLACFIRALLFGEPLLLVDGGKSRRSFIHVKDFTDAVARIIRNPEVCQGEIINIGDPANEVSVAELAAKMVAAYQKLYGTLQTPDCKEVSAEAFYGPGYDDTERRVPDIGKALRLLSWKPSTSLDQMLPAIIKDYVERYRDRVPEIGERVRKADA